jgi:hypothetical protein
MNLLGIFMVVLGCFLLFVEGNLFGIVVLVMGLWGMM